MCQNRPIGGLEWMTEFENWRNISCILEVDLEYPNNLHDFHNDYPLAPKEINYKQDREADSKYQK